MRIIFSFFLLFISGSITAQQLQLTPVYDKCYNDTFEVGGGRMCKPLPNGNGYVIVGDSRLAMTDGKPHHGTFSVSWNEDAYIAITDNNFNVIKSNIFGGSTANDGNDYFSDVFPQADGSFVCFGEANSDDGEINSPAAGMASFLFKVDSNLNKVWSAPYGNNLGGMFPMDCIQSKSGDFYMLCASNGPSGDNNIDLDNDVFAFDWTVIKMDSAGNKQWAKVYGSSNSEYSFGSLVEDAAHNIYILSSGVEGDNDCVSIDTTWRQGLNTGYDIFVLKLDSAGNRLWTKSYGGTNFLSYESPFCALYDMSTDELLLGGRTDSKDLLFSNAQHLDDEAFFIRMDTAGAIKQVKLIGGNSLDFATQISLGPNPNTYLLGINTQSNNDGDFINYTNGSSDFVIVLISSQGSFIMKYGTNQSFSEYMDYSFYFPVRNEVIVAADFGPHAQLQCDTIKHSTNIYKPGMRRLRFDPLGINEQIKKPDNFTIYPNPTKELFYVKSIDNTDYKLSLFDLSGKLLLERTRQEAALGVSVGKLTQATYIIKIQSDKYVSYKKLIISP